jgi:hypothetical protein
MRDPVNRTPMSIPRPLNPEHSNDVYARRLVGHTQLARHGHLMRGHGPRDENSRVHDKLDLYNTWYYPREFRIRIKGNP